MAGFDIKTIVGENYGGEQKDFIAALADEISRSIEDKYSALFKSSYPLIPVGVSNRHIHLTEKTFKKLFGQDAKFEEMRPLYQPGEFASKHTLTIVGSKLRAIEKVRILGPLRKYDQVEISLTDSIYLGLNPPVTNSGSLDTAAPITLVGPKSSVFLERGAIIANRHIHMTSGDALVLGVKNGDYCKVRIAGIKSTIFENVLIRINDNWRLQMHLDTDDANAAFIKGEVYAEYLGKM
ncbi:Propanediol utilization protein [Melioribacter roseus P3M-2]|uniref:Phosphate propanoyltransferase n=1 Tax=Melioribacter roseus (strain DSM 23840 / JCM 17771 / VKM B-2668 / P3M-2) TaxID=1191523 RepID=I6ZMV2_MELRP|nr:phosphate propanoyltransferase [Melioribacter roseus]AFN73349.1 Propanediol utilization protein [Melioribacter roseus P3M-2]